MPPRLSGGPGGIRAPATSANQLPKPPWRLKCLLRPHSAAPPPRPAAARLAGGDRAVLWMRQQCCKRCSGAVQPRGSFWTHSARAQSHGPVAARSQPPGRAPITRATHRQSTRACRSATGQCPLPRPAHRHGGSRRQHRPSRVNASGCADGPRSACKPRRSPAHRCFASLRCPRTSYAAHEAQRTLRQRSMASSPPHGHCCCGRRSPTAAAPSSRRASEGRGRRPCQVQLSKG